MFKDAEELKEFVIWAKSQGIQHVKVQDIEITFSNYAMLQTFESQSPSVGVKEMAASQPKTEEEIRLEEEELLFHSSIS